MALIPFFNELDCKYLVKLLDPKYLNPQLSKEEERFMKKLNELLTQYLQQKQISIFLPNKHEYNIALILLSLQYINDTTCEIDVLINRFRNDEIRLLAEIDYYLQKVCRISFPKSREEYQQNILEPLIAIMNVNASYPSSTLDRTSCASLPQTQYFINAFAFITQIYNYGLVYSPSYKFYFLKVVSLRSKLYRIKKSLRYINKQLTKYFENLQSVPIIIYTEEYPSPNPNDDNEDDLKAFVQPALLAFMLIHFDFLHNTNYFNEICENFLSSSTTSSRMLERIFENDQRLANYFPRTKNDLKIIKKILPLLVFKKVIAPFL